MELIETGKVVGTHGIAGEVKVQAWADSLELMLGFEYVYIDGHRFGVEYARIHKNNILYKFYGIDNLNKAELLRSKIIYVERSFFSLEEGEYFIKDLLTLHVVDADTGKNYGLITDVLKTGANDVYELTDSDGVIRMIPAIKQVIIETDIENKIMKIRPLNGLFDED
ncbi:MAG: 16S rRNA processing protein RimM [Clostridia bacterium]|nr:16S rRNA processing protein RimM [Clostridia bacterium]